MKGRLRGDLSELRSREWLETNGRGGFASGSLAFAPTRRYHGMLLVARRPPVDRIMLVNHVHDRLQTPSGEVPLSSTFYPDAVHPRGFRRIRGFGSDPWPTWEYEWPGGRLTREVLMVQDRDLTVLRWTLPEGEEGTRLVVRPFLSGRDDHATHQHNDRLDPTLRREGSAFGWRTYPEIPPVFVRFDGDFHPDPHWYYRVRYPVERARGLDFEEDWWTPGECRCRLDPGKSVHIAFGTEPLGDTPIERLVDRERRRRSNTAPIPARNDGSLFERLRRAARAFVVRRDGGQSLVAGYPWFRDWGRDTFVSLPGLLLVPGQYETARRILETYAKHISRGMIPNRFPDQGDNPQYNSIDASLWFIHAIGRYLAYSGDERWACSAGLAAVRRIIEGYRGGTRFGIRVEEDGLVRGGEPGVQLTWMDAVVGERVITPRRGKPVEVQGLWLRALEVGCVLARRAGKNDLAARWKKQRKRARSAFRGRFWYEEGGYCHDVVDGPGGDDPTLRPNQLFVLMLGPEVLPEKRAKSVLRVVEDKLLTPVGVRTLPPDHPNYHGEYGGNPSRRDEAYHQGTVWPYLLGPFVTGWLRVHGHTAPARRRARSFLDGLQSHLNEVCVGQISEVFDGEPPHRPGGCFAQAWSVAEPLRVLGEDLRDTSGQQERECR